MAKDRRGSRRRVLLCEQQEHFKDIKFTSSGASICRLRCFEASMTQSANYDVVLLLNRLLLRPQGKIIEKATFKGVKHLPRFNSVRYGKHSIRLYYIRSLAQRFHHFRLLPCFLVQPKRLHPNNIIVLKVR